MGQFWSGRTFLPRSQQHPGTARRFRHHGMGGAAGYFGVTPDLTVLGKAVAGGYPMAGGVGGSAEVMSVFRPSVFADHDTSREVQS